MTADDVRSRFDDAPMNLFRVRTVVLTLLISALDGYDALSISFAAPAISGAWGLGKAALGVVLSSSLAGMAVGALLLAPVADVIGRKKLMLVGLTLMALGSLLSALASGIGQLMLWRFLTGAGIGSCVAVITTVTAEFANRRRRPLALALMSIGYPIGGLVGGLLAAWLLARFTWHSIFIAGSVAGAVMIPLIAVLLPESLAFLLGRDRPRQLEQINAVLARCDLPVLDAAPALSPQRRGYAGVFHPAQRAITARLAIVSAMCTSTAYFALSWLPQIVHQAGLTPSDASLVAAAASLAGIVGGLFFGFVARGSRQARITAIFLIGEGAAMATFGVMPPTMLALAPAGALIGFFLYAAATGFYAILPQSFPDSSRAAGTGFVMGVGRFASTVSPTFAGWLLAEGLGVPQLFALFGGGAAIAGLVLLGHRALLGAPDAPPHPVGVR